MKKNASRAFTLVEILIVIVVLSILVAITATIYGSVETQARDAKNADGADKVADAISLFTIKYGHVPAGGTGSSVAIGSGNECTSGSGGWFATGYACDIEDSLIASGYLPADFANNLSQNMTYPSITDGSRALMVENVSSSGTPPRQKLMVLYSMADPSPADTSNFNNELTKCYGSVPAVYAPRDTNGMRNGTCLVLQTVQ